MNQHNDSMDKSGELQAKIANDAYIAEMGKLLFSLEASIKQKESALYTLAHIVNDSAYKLLKAYNEYPDEEFVDKAKLAFEKCCMFLDLAKSFDEDDDEDEMIHTGVGQKKNMIRIYYLLLPERLGVFENEQHDIIRLEMTALSKKLECEGIEWFDCKPNYVGFSLLLSHKVSVSQFIDAGIAACNAFVKFVYSYCYASTNIPTATEIDEIIEIVRYGDDDED